MTEAGAAAFLAAAVSAAFLISAADSDAFALAGSRFLSPVPEGVVFFVVMLLSC